MIGVGAYRTWQHKSSLNRLKGQVFPFLAARVLVIGADSLQINMSDPFGKVEHPS